MPLDLKNEYLSSQYSHKFNYKLEPQWAIAVHEDIYYSYTYETFSTQEYVSVYSLKIQSSVL